MRTRAILAILAAALLLAACQRTDEDATATPGPTVTPEVDRNVPVGEPLLEDGVHFGFIRTVADPRPVQPSLTFDPAELFTGRAATVAAIEDGEIDEGQEWPQEHYIRNPEHEFLTFPIGPDVEILLIDREDCCEPVPVDLPTVAAEFERPQGEGRFVGADAPYVITILEGRVVRIEEVYLED